MQDDREAAHRQLREALAARDLRRWRGRLLARIPKRPKREPIPGPAPDRRPVRRARVLAVPLGVAAGAVALSALRPAIGPPTSPPRPPTRAEVVSGRSPSTTEPPPTGPERIWPAQPFSVTGNEVRSGEARWVIGGPGDLVVIGKWGCDVGPTPAVLRPASGTLYVFDRWAGDGEEVTARAVRNDLVGAIAATADGCGSALVTFADGTQRRIDVGEEL